MPAGAEGLVTKTKPKDLSPRSTEPLELGITSALGAPWLADAATLMRVAE